MENNINHANLFNQVSCGIIIQDHTGTIVAANDYASQIFNDSSHKLIGLDNNFHTKIALKENGMEFLDDFPTDLALKGKTNSLPTTVLIKKGNNSKWVDIISKPELDENNKLISVITTIIDVTNRVKLNRELIEVENFHQNIIDQIPLAIFWKDKDLNYLGGNQLFCDVAGVFSAEELVGKTDYDLAWPEHASAFREYDRQIIEKGEALYHIIEPQKQASGNTAWLDTNKIPLFTNNGEPSGLLGTFENITQRLIKEKETEKSHLLLSEAINSIPSAIIGVNKDLNITFWNKAATDLTSISASFALNKNIIAFPPFKELNLVIKQVGKDNVKFTDNNFTIQHDNINKSVKLSIFSIRNKSIIIQIDSH